ncbi:MAG: family 43 glycosylhydrolase [Prevotella sp.]|nr:family 43 glycosylhydrolase [Prevotella sp.]
MYLRNLILALFIASWTHASAQEIAKANKPVGNGNPISPCVFCADPTALVYDGRIYVYGTNDHQQFIVNGKKGDNGYGNIKSLVVFSTDDLANWTFHGTIDVGKVCGSWCGQSWAPSAVWRETENGQKEFFIYFANGGGSVGVIKGSTPVGPFRSPLSRALITGSSPGVSPCNWVFDPGVVIDENGTGWIAFGGGDPNAQGSKLLPNNARIAKLKDTMIALDGKAVSLPAPYHFEASELNIFDGKFAYTYCTSWSDRNDWYSYSKRGTAKEPTACSMCYMVSDDPLNPDSWEYKGQYLANPGTFGYSYSNNHSHLQKFGDNYYLFYHTTGLEQNMNTGASGFRSIAVNKAIVTENTQRISTVTANNTGAQATGYLNPYQLQEAETMSTAGGITYEDFSNIMKVPTYNTLGNDASQNLQVKMAPGAWTMVRRVNFGKEGAKSFMLRAKGTGTLEIRLGSLSAEASDRVEFSSTSYNDYTIELTDTRYMGTRNVYFVFTQATNVYFDAWQFTENTSDGIRPVSNAQDAPTKYFDLTGKQIPNVNQHHGIIIEQQTNANGTTTHRKRMK